MLFKEETALEISAPGGSCGTLIKKKQQSPGRRAGCFLSVFKQRKHPGDKDGGRELRNYDQEHKNVIKAKEEEKFYVGIDFREEFPKVCYRKEQMGEVIQLPLDFTGFTKRGDFFRKILSVLNHFVPKEKIWTAVVLPDMLKETVEQFSKDACEAGFVQEQLQFMEELESVVHFVMHQTNDIWQQRVFVLEFGEKAVKSVSLSINHKTLPMLVDVTKPEYWEIGSISEGNRDERLLEAAEEPFHQGPISAVFLAGTDFNAQDYKKSRELICSHRRVFLAEQLYARGACMAVSDGDKKRSYLFLNEHTLMYNVGIQSVNIEKDFTATLVEAGCRWFEAKKTCELILLEEPVLQFVFQPLLGTESIHAKMALADIPKRPAKASRILLEIHFEGPRQCEIKVSDLGFGELYPASDLVWKQTFWLDAGEEGTLEYGIGDSL